MSEGSYNESDDEHLFPHPDDVLSYCIYVSDSETESWGEEAGYNTEPPQDLELIYWEQAIKKEDEYLELLYQEYGEKNEVYNALEEVRNLPDDDDMEDDNYQKHINVLWQMVNWRNVKDREFMNRYEFVYDGLLKSKYVLGTKYLRRIVESYDNWPRSFFRHPSCLGCYRQGPCMSCNTGRDREIQDFHQVFEAPMNADGILEMVEAFTYDGGKLMRNGMEEAYDAGMTYEKEFKSLLRALEDRHSDCYGSHRDWIKGMMETRQVREYRDDIYIEAMVKAYVEHNIELMYEAGHAFQEYRSVMKPFYKYGWYYNELRKKKRKNIATRRQMKGGNKK